MKKNNLYDVFSTNIAQRRIDESATIADAVAVMRHTGHHCLLVTSDNDKAVGILSEHDIVTAFAADNDQAKKSHVADYMTLDMYCIQEDKSLDEAIQMMAQKNIRHMPIVSKAGHIISLISIMELIMAKMTYTGS